MEAAELKGINGGEEEGLLVATPGTPKLELS